MDELVHHCLQELSFDGDLGCNVSRLRDFIVGFYSHGSVHPQVVDDAFCAFVWSIVVQHPTVRVGMVPAGISSEVYIAPQTSAKRKAAAKGEVHVEEAPPVLSLVDNARGRSLEDLKAEYGEDVRIAVDPDTSFTAITGSHIKSSKISPMVYSALQLITRGREEGITTVELGRKTKYDQKTCFYLLKQLLELGLIIKARRGGVGNHTCIHKYFVERSAFWKEIQEEEAKDDEVEESRLQDGASPEDETPATESLKLDFGPVDSRHMSSLQLIKNRVVKLLKASQNNMHALNNLIVTIGFANPTKTDRRFFQTRLRELMAQGVIERVKVPHPKIKDRYVKCIRLVTPDNQLPEGGVIISPQEGEEDDKEIAADDVSAGRTEIKANRTIQRQVSDLLEEAGSVGRTLNEICGALGNFDKRTIELLLARATKNRPPAHLCDLGTADFMESFGRERRHRYYTLTAYKTLMANENFDDTTEIDLSKVGAFATFNEGMFYADEEALHSYQDAYMDKEGAKSKKSSKKRKRGELDGLGHVEAVEDEPEMTPKAKRGRPRKKPIGEDNGGVPTPKARGRPRKQPLVDGDGGGGGGETPTGLEKHDQPHMAPIPEEDGRTATIPVVPKRRGRAPKRRYNIDQLSPPNPSVATGEPGVVSPFPLPPVLPSSETPPESQRMAATTPVRLGPSLSAKPPAAPEPLTSSPREGEVDHSPQKSSELTSSVVHESPDDDQHLIIHAKPVSGEQTVIQTSPHIAGVTPLVGELERPQSGLTDAHLEEPAQQAYHGQLNSNLQEDDSFRLTGQMHSAASGAEIEGLRGEGSTDPMDAIEAHTDTPAQEPIIDPALLTPSSLVERDMTPTVHGVKRKGSPSLALPPQAAKRVRRSTPSDKSKTSKNISHIRRENELLRVIQDLGGIANLHTRDFLDTHVALLDDMARRGEPASAPPGTRLDRRTADTAVRSMENRGLIKVLKTAVFSTTGSARPACLLYPPDTPQEKINAFLHRLSHSTPTLIIPQIKTIEEPVDFGSRGASRRSTLGPETQEEHARRIARASRKAQTRQKRNRAQRREKRNIEAKAKFQSRVKEAKVQRENDWEALLQSVYPEPLKGTIGIRIRDVRNRFMQASSTRDVDRWRGEIEKAIRDAQLASDRVLARPQVVARPRPTTLPRVVTNIPEKSVQFLIAQQGPPIPAQQHSKSKGKTRLKGEGQEEQSQSQAPQQRRSRFLWTREYDELARDASAVIRARCRDGIKMDLSAFDQVFPSVPRNSVRLRIAHLRENSGEDVYMKRLEDRWYDLWIQHRGTEHLPDEDPRSPSNFDVAHHIEFLRKHVDKNALRVGYIENTTRTKLPASIEGITRNFNVVSHTTVSPAWEFMWQANVEEGREKQFLRQSFTHGANEIPYVTNPSDDAVQVAEAAMKMVFGMPSEHYDSGLAATMLHRIGDQHVSLATSNLLRRGVLSKLVRDPKKMKPGRTLKISDANLNAIGGSIHRDLFQDAVALDDVFAEQVDSMEWPLVASDGDIAALLQMVSEDQVDFTIDIAQLRNSRARLDWNSKKADDNDIETSIRVQVRLNTLDEDDDASGGSAILPSDESRSSPTCLHLDASMEHGKTIAGTDAACSLKTQTSIVDCGSCIESTFSQFVAPLDGERQRLARNIFDQVRASSESGTSKSHCLALGAHDIVMDLLQRMSQTSPPLILWVGYSAPVIVSSHYARAWAMEVSGESNSTNLALPRRWLDIHGDKIRGTWDAALHAVVGIVIFHPGISQTELRWRLRAVFDRQELVDVLCFLCREETIYARGETEHLSGPIWPATLDDGEEQRVFWFMGKSRHWYQI